MGYITTVTRDTVIYYSGQCVKKEYEKTFVNHALIYGMLDYYKNFLSDGGYIVDGERNINHVTNHQEFLVKKFGFRKVNCRLNVEYRPSMKVMVKILYPFRNIFIRWDSTSSIIHKVNAVMLLESIRRGDSKLAIRGAKRE